MQYLRGNKIRYRIIPLQLRRLFSRKGALHRQPPASYARRTEQAELPADRKRLSLHRFFRHIPKPAEFPSPQTKIHAGAKLFPYGAAEAVSPAGAGASAPKAKHTPFCADRRPSVPASASSRDNPYRRIHRKCPFPARCCPVLRLNSRTALSGASASAVPIRKGNSMKVIDKHNNISINISFEFISLSSSFIIGSEEHSIISLSKIGI